jgi:hypothetical protein
MEPSEVSEEEMNKRCKFLQSLGFKIDHEDSRVSLYGRLFDFSATRMEADAVMDVVVRQSYSYGYDDGKNEFITKAKELFQIR